MRRARALAGRTIRATGHIVRDRRVPRPVRWAAAVALLPVPGPLDEAVLLLVAPYLAVFHRREMREAWRAAGEPERPARALPPPAAPREPVRPPG